MLRSDARAVIVTGAGRGIGLAIARKLVASDYLVVGIGRTVSEEFLSLPKQLRHFYQFDLTHIDQIGELVLEIVGQIDGAPYGLINNSGIGKDGILPTQHDSDIAEVLTLNLSAPILLTKYFVRQMIRKRQGRVVNISSIIARTGFRGLSVYGASKAGLEGFTRSIAREVGSRGITVNCVAPGFVDTSMTEGLTSSQRQSIERRSPLGMPEPNDVANAVSFLLGPEAARITGTTVTVDGGSTS